jgi:glycosyltransferase involved in cell wall biosynthesis
MVSVCIATFNGEAYIKKQVSSILKQLDKNDEIVISDDGSYDKTIEIIHSFADKRIKLFKHSKSNIVHPSATHIKVSANFENAIKNAKGEYIFLSDQDDVWFDNKLATMLNFLENNILVFSNFSIIDSSDRIVRNTYFSKNPISHSFLFNIIKFPFFGCSIAFQRDLLNYILPFPENIILHDNWIGFIAQKKGNIKYIEEALFSYRIHNCNVSYNGGKTSNSILYRILYRIQFYLDFKNRISCMS